MVRTLVSLHEEDKNWLDNYSHKKHSSIAEVIRSAIKQYKKTVQTEADKSVFSETAGLWKSQNEDGLKYVERLRQEWE